MGTSLVMPDEAEPGTTASAAPPPGAGRGRDPAGRPSPDDSPVQGSQRGRGRWLRVTVLGALLAFLVPVSWSYAAAVTQPGTDSLGSRSVEWLRDHGFNGVVTGFENFWYSHHAPKKGGLPAHGLPAPAPVTGGSTGAKAAPRPPASPRNIAPFASPPLPNEGVWVPTGRLVDGLPVLWTAFLRPDPVHTSLVTGVAYLDSRRLRAVMYQGYQEPGGTGWKLVAPISPALRPELVAAFNSGFRLQHSRGGYLAEGRLVRPLLADAASFVISANGTATVGEWGRDVTMVPDVIAVRQNLSLIVDNGVPVPGLDQDVGGRWGFTIGNRILVWRSGVGVTRDGSIVYAAGNGLSVETLANVLGAAGVVRAMELDINSAWTDFFSYTGPDLLHPEVVSTKLLPGMQPPPDRYFRPSSRDFIAFYIR